MPAPDDVTGSDAGTPPPDVTLDAPPVTDDARPSAALAEARAHRIESNQGAIGRAVAHEVHATQGAIGVARAEVLEFREGAIGVLAARQVEARDTVVGLMVARHVGGDVRVLLDWRSVAAAVGAVLVIGRLLRGRR
ncbi:MAG: hypothetical protein U0667_00390 [Chloroflexota bacterium]